MPAPPHPHPTQYRPGRAALPGCIPAREAIQIATGLTIPLLLFPHLADVRGSHELVASDDQYGNVLPFIWPDRAWRKSVLLLVVRVHTCISLHFWLRMSPLYRRVFPLALALAVVIPVGYGDDGYSSSSGDSYGSYGANPNNRSSSSGYGYDDYGPSTATLKAREQAALLAHLRKWVVGFAYGVGGTATAILLMRWIVRRFRSKSA